ncbi:MAG: FG-GAP repeat protein [Gomphosphaeria aponina SAG 52.96 = DSM 107014]|uniref:FG-GAP repeat protein n=1 Tax=Gomphosphaeria aponina SAG 52.96 = DSM 107014 TaxID=1521640 RepID=A0A941GMA2_9CHRO|nr:FG-GAP repeat protein [Gomphosphaeria aponina SAG 52.96 = DSM 107014]
MAYPINTPFANQEIVNPHISSNSVWQQSNNNNTAFINLASLDGKNGFKINNEPFFTYEYPLINSVSSAGDINGDNIDDIVIGASNGGRKGKSYVVFGKESDFESEFNLADLDGTNGFKINGESKDDDSGYSVSSAGDINGDGFDDLLVSAPGADPNGTFLGGRIYVVFGDEDFEPRLNLDDLDGTNGFKINGEGTLDSSGNSVSSVGDINGDDIDDIVIGAFNNLAPNSEDSGKSYVVFGDEDFESELELEDLDGTNGFKINGEAEGDFSGRSVSGAGDINGDDIDDVVIGAYRANINKYGQSVGKSYVVFGKDSDFESEVNLADLDGTNGFKINGEAAFPGAGFSVSDAGDINGDNIDDVIIGAERGYSDGRSYVVFGSPEIIDGTIEGTPENDTLRGTAENDVIKGLGGKDLLFGDLGNDTLNGGKALDRLVGQGGSDILLGKARSDRLTGSEGNDQLTGGAGADWFRFNLPKHGVDIITDFELGKDQIRINASKFGGGLVAGDVLPSEQFVLGTGAVEVNDRFIYNNGALFYDQDGLGGVEQVQIATLMGAPALGADDIYLF